MQKSRGKERLEDYSTSAAGFIANICINRKFFSVLPLLNVNDIQCCNQHTNNSLTNDFGQLRFF